MDNQQVPQRKRRPHKKTRQKAALLAAESAGAAPQNGTSLGAPMQGDSKENAIDLDAAHGHAVPTRMDPRTAWMDHAENGPSGGRRTLNDMGHQTGQQMPVQTKGQIWRQRREAREKERALGQAADESRGADGSQGQMPTFLSDTYPESLPTRRSWGQSQVQPQGSGPPSELLLRSGGGLQSSNWREHTQDTGSHPPPDSSKASLSQPLVRGLKKKPRTTARNKTPSPAPVPIPSDDYITRAEALPSRLSKPQPLLLILDLNGTLLHRPSRSQSANIISRADMAAFISHILTVHSVMVWSSARAENVSLMCSKVFSKSQRSSVLLEWGRDKLGLNSWEFNQKVQVYKRLEKAWKARKIAKGHPEGRTWDQSNTVLIDDSVLKAASQPYNIVEVPEFKGKREGKRVLREVAAYLEEARWYEDVSAFIREKPFEVGGELGGRSPLDGYEVAAD